jgi:hypothetical protein
VAFSRTNERRPAVYIYLLIQQNCATTNKQQEKQQIPLPGFNTLEVARQRHKWSAIGDHSPVSCNHVHLDLFVYMWPGYKKETRLRRWDTSPKELLD